MTELPVTMRGVWLIGHGDMDKLDIRQDIPVPVPGPFDVLVRVAAAGVNNTDINTRTAWYSKKRLPVKMLVGRVSRLRSRAFRGSTSAAILLPSEQRKSSTRIGERVLIEPCLREAHGKELDQPWFFGSECDGGFAEFTVVATRHAHKIDSELSDQMVSFPCSYSTAENMLTRARVKSG